MLSFRVVVVVRVLAFSSALAWGVRVVFLSHTFFHYGRHTRFILMCIIYSWLKKKNEHKIFGALFLEIQNFRYGDT